MRRGCFFLEGKALTGDAGRYLFTKDFEKLTGVEIRDYLAMRGGVEKMERDETRDYAARKMTTLEIRKYAAF
jgi:hypothetical protein